MAQIALGYDGRHDFSKSHQPRTAQAVPWLDGDVQRCFLWRIAMRLRIYLVEDSPVIRQALSESLEELVGARVVGCASAEAEACQWLADNPSSWDLAVVDLFLLQGNGLNVVKSCSNRALRQKVVVLTNYATPPIRQRCLAIGADAVFDKGTEIDEFTAYAIDEVERVSGETLY